LDEAALFPHGQNDDQVDAVASALDVLAFGRKSKLIV
jgi:phage terminase large subunit-like protein